MKQSLYLSDWHETLPSVKLCVLAYARARGFHEATPTLGQIIEMLAAFSYAHHYEEILHGVKNHVLDLDEFVVAWDGEEPLDIGWYKLQEILKQRLIR